MSTEEESEEGQKEQAENNSNNLARKGILALGLELAYIIALPVIILGLSGKWLDGKTNTEPLFTLFGVFLAIATTTLWIYKKFGKHFPK